MSVPNRLWVIVSTDPNDSEIFGVYREGQTAEKRFEAIRNLSPNKTFKLTTYLQEGART